jgi:hypothetical protein
MHHKAEQLDNASLGVALTHSPDLAHNALSNPISTNKAGARNCNGGALFKRIQPLWLPLSPAAPAEIAFTLTTNQSDEWSRVENAVIFFVPNPGRNAPRRILKNRLTRQ